MPAPEEPASLPDRQPQNGLVYDLDWDEDARLAEWQDVLADTRELPAVLRAAILLEAWSDIEVLQHAAWLGPLLVRRAAAAGRARRGPSRLPASRRQEHSAGAPASTKSKRSIVGVCRRHPGGSAGWIEGARSAGAGEKPDGAAAARTPRQLETARPGRAGAVAADRLHRHDPGAAKSLEAGCAQPRRRAQPARDDGEGEVSGVGDSLKKSAFAGLLRLVGFAPVDTGGKF